MVHSFHITFTAGTGTMGRICMHGGLLISLQQRVDQGSLIHLAACIRLCGASIGSIETIKARKTPVA